MSKIVDITDFVYENRFKICIEYNIQCLADVMNVNVARLHQGLKKKYDFDYTKFRKILLSAYVFSTRDLKTSKEILRELNISPDYLTKIYNEIGLQFGRGGDRRSDNWADFDRTLDLFENKEQK